MNPTDKLRHSVFWPPFLGIIAAVGLCFYDETTFLSQATQLNDLIIQKMGWLYSLGTFLMVLTCFWLFFSPIGNVRIGGKDAKPLLNRWRWFSITLCSTVAVGILFWAMAEPLYHFHSPPISKGIAPGTLEAARFSMSTMFLHWTITPYAIYAVPTLMFALSFYNMKKPFSLGSTLIPLLGRDTPSWLVDTIDGICLYVLVAGMAASLGSGVLTLAGGMEHLFGIEGSSLLLGGVCAAVVVTFILSAVSGLMKGIRVLSDINAKIFFAICIFVFVSGPTAFLVKFGGGSLWHFFTHFVESSFFVTDKAVDSWPQSWTLFYWANWLAWAPITAVFLGRLCYGYKVKEVLIFNWILPACFAGVWMIGFSGTTLEFELLGNAGLMSTLQEKGPQAISYAVFSKLPLSSVVIPVFIGTVFLSYVTAADSNASAMGGISSIGLSVKHTEPPTVLKVLWGGLVGMMAWLMVSIAGIDGIRMLSNLGGLPALLLVLAIMVALLKVSLSPSLLRGETKKPAHHRGTIVRET